MVVVAKARGGLNTPIHITACMYVWLFAQLEVYKCTYMHILMCTPVFILADSELILIWFCLEFFVLVFILRLQLLLFHWLTVS